MATTSMVLAMGLPQPWIQTTFRRAVWRSPARLVTGAETHLLEEGLLHLLRPHWYSGEACLRPLPTGGQIPVSREGCQRVKGQELRGPILTLPIDTYSMWDPSGLNVCIPNTYACICIYMHGNTCMPIRGRCEN